VRGANPLVCGRVVWANVEFVGDVKRVHRSWRECRAWRLAPVCLGYLYPLCSLLLECQFHFECEEGQEQLAPQRSSPETLFIFLLRPLPYVRATAKASRGELWERAFLGVSNKWYQSQVEKRSAAGDRRQAGRAGGAASGVCHRGDGARRVWLRKQAWRPSALEAASFGRAVAHDDVERVEQRKASIRA
jgi:hypothetical protein